MSKITTTALIAEVAESATSARKRLANAKAQKASIAFALKLAKPVLAAEGLETFAFVSANSYSEDVILYIPSSVQVEDMKGAKLAAVLETAETLGWTAEDSRDLAWENGAQREFKYITYVGKVKVNLSIKANLIADGEACRVEQVGVEVVEKPVFAIKCA